MDGLLFSIAGTPRGKGRPRARLQQPKGRKPFAQIYTDEQTREYEEAVAKAARKAMAGAEPFTGALSVSLQFRLQPAKSMPKRERAPIIAGEVPYFGLYDADNLAKSMLDGMNGVCWADDRQITRLFVVKVASDAPGVDVKITPLEPQEVA
jgi:Holliday junction resolvase RusA-like endonuclease